MSSVPPPPPPTQPPTPPVGTPGFPPPAQPTEDGRVELRPSTEAYFADMGKRAWILIPLILFMGIRAMSSDSGLGAVGLVVLIGVTAACSIVGVMVHFRTTRAVLESGGIRITGALIRDRTLRLDGSQRGLLTTLTQPMTPPSPMLVLHNAAEGTTIRLSGAVWSLADLQRIAAHAGTREDDTPHTAADIERQIPGSMPLWLRRPWLVGFGVAILLIVVIAAIVLAVV